ncbi:hypothetical protein [Nostoc sp. ChiQUE01b]|nr:hypothetical protein [Nostoc sp. ChiQUE01b]MDZ8256955.1 hypothetical protein [Nostoc sp. ChiQUE01b]
MSTKVTGNLGFDRNQRLNLAVKMFWRDGEQTKWEVTHLDVELEVST